MTARQAIGFAAMPLGLTLARIALEIATREAGVALQPTSTEVRAPADRRVPVIRDDQAVQVAGKPDRERGALRPVALPVRISGGPL